VRVGGSPAGSSPTVSYREVDTQAIIDDVLTAFRRRPTALGSALLQDDGTSKELAEQVRSVLQDVLVLPASGGQSTSLLSIEVGPSRTRRGIHPVESLRVAGELFDVALPIIVRHCGFQDLEILNVSRRLHQSIMRRVSVASLPYVEFLLAKLHSSREEERHRISRELHDRVGHGMALALQHFDLHRYFSEFDDVRAEREFRAGFTSLDEALRTVSSFSAELRRSVGDDGVKAAIESYLQDNVPDKVDASLEIIGDAKMLSAPVSEELYLIMREACRNALRHGYPTELRLTIKVTESEVTAAVSDNGIGFSAEAPDTPVGGGLPSMRERAELLNGSLTVESAIGEGTTVTVQVPLTCGGTP
jgi:signal transduction histidine kinase